MKNKKRIILTVVVGMFCLCSNVFGQNITMSLKQTTVKSAMEKLEKEYGYSFVFESMDVNTQKKISINLQNASLHDAINQILKDQPISFEVVNKNIIIKKGQNTSDRKGLNLNQNQNQNQKIKVTGAIRDAAGESIIGASVMVEGTANATVTDLDGVFVIEAFKGATLKISYLGFRPQTVIVGEKSNLEITLEENNELLDEVVVIGYGSVKKSSLTNAVSKFNAENLSERSLARAESALQGNLAGVMVRSTTGEPGQDLQIRVRGAASVNASADPLYVVDGMPLSTLTGINPSDIESMEVLKDAASAAIYGSRGANGVILVTTKKGKSGKPKISFSASYGTQTLEKKLDLMSAEEWMEFYIKYNDANYLSQANARGIVGASIKDSNEKRMTNLGGSVSKPDYRIMLDDRWFNYMSDDIRNSHTYTATDEQLNLLDWQDEYYRNASIQDYNVSVSGGNDVTNYLFSLGYLNQDGIVVGTNYERYSFRTNIESKINKYITAGMLLAPTYIERDGGGVSNGKDSFAHQILQIAPVSEGSVGYDTNVNSNLVYPWAVAYSSPVYRMQNNINKEKMVHMMGNAFIRFDPIKDLKIETTASANYYNRDRKIYNFSKTSGNAAQGEGQNSSASRVTNNKLDYLLQAVANYNKTIQEHEFSIMAGVSNERKGIGSYTSQAFSKPFPNDAITGSFNGDNLNVAENIVSEHTPTIVVSYFGRLNYNYDNRYIIAGSLRYDGSTVFGINNKWGSFPSISGAWNVSNEQFYKNLNISWLNSLKLRASYGVTGNNSISETAAYSTLGSVIYSGEAGYIASTLGNKDLGWEKTYSTDLAIDLGLFKNRIQLSLDWYTKNTKDLLYQIPVYSASGFSSTWGNLGDIYNEGFEIELTSRNIDSEFKWSTNLNISFNKNEVRKLGESDTPIYSGFDSNNPSNVLMVGKPINTFYMYDAIGVWMTQAEIDEYSASHGGVPVTFEGKAIKPGDIRYRDVNDDGFFDKTNDRDFLGSPTPKVTYGMTNTFSYKNLDLSILITAQTGGKIAGLIGRAIDRPSMGPNQNALAHWKDAWWSESEPGNGSVPYALSTTTGGTVDSRWLYSSNFLRIKNLTLGYKLPVNPKILPYARVYLSIENLAKWDSYYGGYNTESANTGSATLGIDYGSYPLARTIMFGVNVNF